MIDRSKLPFTSNALKLIACVTMLIDHTAAVLVEPLVPANPSLYTFYKALRIIGRIAMPIYCYRLALGAVYTRNKKKYLLRMLLFALLSEIPFDMAFNDHVLEFTSQSVMVTLSIGLCCCLASEFFKEKIRSALWVLPSLAAFAAGGVLATLAQCDYEFIGIVFVAGFYFFREKPVLQIIVLAAAAGPLTMLHYHMNTMPLEVWALLAMIPILLYNGRKGSDSRALQYGFYAFYPVHLTALAAIGLMTGLSTLVAPLVSL